MHAAKKVALDVGVAVLLLLLALLVAALVAMRRPDCVTCGSRIGLTFWFVVLGAFQPALWTRGIPKQRRFWLWLLAAALGVASYLLLEWVAGWLFSVGQGGTAISLGVAANEVAVIVGVVSSWALIRREQRRQGQVAN